MKTCLKFHHSRVGSEYSTDKAVSLFHFRALVAHDNRGVLGLNTSRSSGDRRGTDLIILGWTMRESSHHQFLPFISLIYSSLN